MKKQEPLKAAPAATPTPSKSADILAMWSTVESAAKLNQTPMNELDADGYEARSIVYEAGRRLAEIVGRVKTREARAKKVEARR